MHTKILLWEPALPAILFVRVPGSRRHGRLPQSRLAPTTDWRPI